MSIKKIRMKEHSGLVTNDTSTTQFSFIISPMKNKAPIEQDDYVALNHPTLGETCPILAIIKEIRSYEQITGSTLGEKVGKMMGIADIIGYVETQNKNQELKKLVLPPDPGSRVYMPYSEFIQELFSTDIFGKPFNPPLLLGKSVQTAISQNNESKNLDYFLDSKNVTNAHTLVTAMDNIGKTHTAILIMEELAKKTRQPIVIFDPYNEYNIEATYEKSSPFRYKTYNLSLDPKKSVQKKQIVTAIKPKQVTTITAQNVTPEKKGTVFSQYLKTLWDSRLVATIPPFTLFIENAEKLETETLEQVVYEGTKYRLALILISKQPSQLGTKIISQMTTQIIGKTTDSVYLNYLKTILPQYVTKIPQLKEKQWIIYTNSQQQSTQITTRNITKTK